MARFYSVSTGCTYLTALHGKDMPADVVEIAEAIYLEVIASPAPGKVRSHDADGQPILIDPPPPTEAALAEQERQWRDLALVAAVALRDRHRDQLEIEVQPTLSGDQFKELLLHMQALRDWPQSSAFPNPEQRPPSPTWLANSTE
jgi:hypothetical protein